MNNEEVRALRKAFDSVKERQAQNLLESFDDRTKRLISSRDLCVGNEGLLEHAIVNLRKNGMKVYLAREKQEALEIILKEIGKEKIIVKSKSNVTKELELTKFLEKNGLTVVETDIGDRILQILDAKPSHPTGPVTHLSAKEIAKGISKYYDLPVTQTPEDIVKIVKADIVSNLEKAKIGITGANAITSEEGSILMTHNEGNIHEVMRKEKHIVVTSIDKIYPDIEAAINMMKILSFNATGSIIPSFVDIISGVSKTADVEKKFVKGVHNPSEIVLVLVDNRRSDLARKGFKELLKCIGCGNCLLHCPMYNTIGNEYAIDSYLGGKGLAYYSLYTNEPHEKLELCLRCGKCRENCPLELDIPEIIKNLRSTGVSSELYYFLKSHMVWVYYQSLLRLDLK
ncbi:MAG TPA: LUD domain-containing protein [Candidatus Methanoperedens sp.]|nr:LUD domain-containing protein [Candidatus Methanoperedens sp.]